MHKESVSYSYHMVFVCSHIVAYFFTQYFHGCSAYHRMIFFIQSYNMAPVHSSLKAA